MRYVLYNYDDIDLEAGQLKKAWEGADSPPTCFQNPLNMF